MKKSVLVAAYTFSVGLILHGWLSERLSLTVKIGLTLGALALIGAAFFLQARWEKREAGQAAKPTGAKPTGSGNMKGVR